MLLLRISNPEARNALHPDVYRDGAAALRAAAEDHGVRAVVLAGEGEHFCAGGNLNRLRENRAQDPSVQAASIDLLGEWIAAIRDCPKPVIAAVERAAAGAGFSLVLACDLVFAAEDARFVMSYAKVGLTCDGGASHFPRRAPALPARLRAAGRRTADRRAPAARAGAGQRAGLARRGVAAALARAAELADGPAFALGRIKSLLSAHGARRWPTSWFASDNFVAALFHDDGAKASTRSSPGARRASTEPGGH